MADNAFVKIGTALLKHQVKKLVGEEAMGAIGEELADIGGDKLDAWLGDKSKIAEIEKAAGTARDLFRGKVNDDEVEQWMVMLPIHDLPAVLSAIEELPKSPDETNLEDALRESIALNWKRLSSAQVNNAVNAFLFALRSALLPIEKQTLMVIGRSVLRIEDKVDQLAKLVEQLRPYDRDAQSNISVGRLNVGGNVGGSVVVGNNNTVTQITNNYYQQIVEKNTEKHEPDFWALKHPYPMPRNFTGRIAERAMLTQWLNEDKENHLFILRALGGFGKSALSWQWITHDVDIKEFPKVLWWSFYEGDASFEHFTEETLKYLNQDAPQSKRDQVDALLKAMQSQKVLLIMDGFERALRAYSSMSAAYQGDEEPKLDDTQLDCVDVNAELFLKGICSLPNIKGKVLMTTRLNPRVIKPRGEFMLGCCEFELTAMQKADAVEFFHKQGIKGNRGEIESACEPYGYHPLSLRLLAGRILKDFENPADIAVAQKLKIDGDIIQQKHHVLDVSYNSLPEPEKRLLGQIACFRSPVEMDTLVQISKPVQTKGVLFGFFKKTLNLYGGKLENDLHDLVERGILHHTTRLISNHQISTFDLHPIVRRFAYDHLTASVRTAAHTRLVNYFEAVPKPEKVEKLEDLAPVIELYHHMVGAGNLDEAKKLYEDRLANPIYFQFGAYQLEIELLRALFIGGTDKPPKLRTKRSQSWTANSLATSYALSGQPENATRLFWVSAELDEGDGDKKNLAIDLGNVATQQLVIGALSDAERNLRRQIEICEKDDLDKSRITGIHYDLGRVYCYLGKWNDAKEQLHIAEDIKKDHVQAKGIICSYRALHFLLLGRQTIDDRQSSIVNLKSAIESAQRALELADETTRTRMNVPRDYVRAHWLLGSAYRVNNELTLAEENLSKALNLCRQINMVDHEANILLDLARLSYAYGSRYSGGNQVNRGLSSHEVAYRNPEHTETPPPTRPSDEEYFKDALEKASEALVITERSGYVLQGADVNLFLAQYALEQEKDKVKAKEYAESALKLAYCDGGEYKYKVAYEEAERMLKELK